MDEYINRDDLLKAAWDKPTLSLSVYDIGNIKSVDVAAVRHGRLEEWDDGFGGTYYHCSVCGEDWCTIDGTPAENCMRYCPQCGARMDGDKDA